MILPPRAVLKHLLLMVIDNGSISYSIQCFSLYTINPGQWEITVLAPGRKHQSISTHEGEGQSAKHLAGYLSLLQPLAPCQG